MKLHFNDETHACGMPFSEIVRNVCGKKVFAHLPTAIPLALYAM